MQSKGRMSGKFNELKIEDRYAQRKREKGVIKHFARLAEGFLLAKQEDSKGARRDSRRMPRTKVVGGAVVEEAKPEREEAEKAQLAG